MDTDKNITELLIKAYEAAPAHIQAFIDEERLDDFMLELQMKTKMQADVAGIVSDRILLTLLGVIAPQELPEELEASGIEREQVESILKAANEAIFLPLREGMRTTPESRVQSQSPSQAQSREAAPLVSVLKPIYVPESRSVPPVEAAATPTYTPPTPEPIAPAYIPPAAPAPAPVVRTMAHDVETMKEGAWTPPTPPAPPVVSTPPLEQPNTASVSPVVTPEPPQVAYIPPRPEPITPREQSIDRVPERKEITDTLKKYGIDPYHEPIE